MQNWQKGKIAEWKVKFRAIEKGLTPSEPIVDHSRYDLILDGDGELVRAQIKYGGRESTRTTGSVEVDLRKMGCSRDFRKYNKTDFDILLVYIPQIDAICCFDDDVWSGRRSLTIRFDSPRNKQTKGILLAEDYLW